MTLPSLVPRMAGSSIAARSCSRALQSSTRSFQTSARSLAPTFAASHQVPVTSQSRPSTRSAHAISNPTLAGIEKRWEAMPPQEQAELWMQLRDRMKVNWNEMTLQEKKAGMSGPTSSSSPSEIRSCSTALVRRRTNSYYSMVDCFWTTWTSCARSSWRVGKSVALHWHWLRCFGNIVLRSPCLCPTTTTNNDKRMAGSDQ